MESTISTAPGQNGLTIPAIDWEVRLDEILLALWHGQLSAEAAVDRTMVEVGMRRS